MKDRRDFLKKMLTLTVSTAACPHFLKGELIPTIKEDGIKAVADFEIDIEKYPELKEEWGSVELNFLNLDANKNEKVYLTRIPNQTTSGFRYFTAINSVCSHEGQDVYPLNTIDHTFTCSGHGSVFDYTGKWDSGPGSPVPLKAYQVFWKPDLQFITVTFDFTAKLSSIAESKVYIQSNYPNPFKDKTTIVYGLAEDSYVSYEIKDVRNRTVIKSENVFKTANEYREMIDMQNFPDGIYFLNIYLNNSLARTKKIIKMS